MNESTLTRLKIIVERAVRPVRSSAAHKRKMREELLAQVAGVFEEEAKVGDEPAALARTQERFGQVADLTGQLQESVPRNDSVVRFGENVFGYESGESAPRVAAHSAAVTGAVSAALLVIAVLIQTLRGEGSEWLTLTRVPALLCPLWFVSFAFFGTLLTRAMRQALLGPTGVASFTQVSLRFACVRSYSLGAEDRSYLLSKTARIRHIGQTLSKLSPD
jgi:hypothetical protein